MFELIIFDCDGVLIDSEWIAIEVEVEALAQLGHRISTDDYLELALGRTCPEVEKRLQEAHAITLPKGYWDRAQSRLKDAFDNSLQPISGVESVLQSLEVPVCVASSSDAARLQHTLQGTGLWSHFNGNVFGAECVSNGKPAPDIFLYAADQMGTHPSKCLVIEDSVHGVQAARRAGMEVWGFHGGKHLTEPSRVEALAEAGATRLFDEMSAFLSMTNRF